MTTEGAHLLVIEDDTRLRDRLRRYLGENGFVVTVAGDTDEARRLMAGLAFDILVVDVMLPGEDGLAFTLAQRRAGYSGAILLLTARGDPDDRIQGLEAGADDYLPKPFEPRELVLRLHSLYRRAANAQMAVNIETEGPIQFGAYEFDTLDGTLTKNGAAIYLTSAEVRLLTLLVEASGAPVSREQLSAGMDAMGERAIDVQVTRLRRKIEDDPRRPAYLQTVRGIGYALRGRRTDGQR